MQYFYVSAMLFGLWRIVYWARMKGVKSIPFWAWALVVVMWGCLLIGHPTAKLIAGVLAWIGLPLSLRWYRIASEEDRVSLQRSNSVKGGGDVHTHSEGRGVHG